MIEVVALTTVVLLLVVAYIIPFLADQSRQRRCRFYSSCS
jgi:hypothetical protein